MKPHERLWRFEEREHAKRRDDIAKRRKAGARKRKRIAYAAMRGLGKPGRALA